MNGVAQRPERGFEEAPSGSAVASRRNVHVDDLAVLVDRPIHVAPDTGDLDVGLVDEPAVPDSMTTGPGRVDQKGRDLRLLRPRRVDIGAGNYRRVIAALRRSHPTEDVGKGKRIGDCQHGRPQAGQTQDQQIGECADPTGALRRPGKALGPTNSGQ